LASPPGALRILVWVAKKSEETCHEQKYPRRRRTQWSSHVGVRPGAITDNPVGLVTAVYTYTDYGGGDVIVTVQNAPAACQHGFWIRMSDPGAKTVFAEVLAAYHAQTPLRMGGYDDQLWPGSTGKHCRLYFVGSGS
jgi:hypothetical protein